MSVENRKRVYDKLVMQDRIADISDDLLREFGKPKLAQLVEEEKAFVKAKKKAKKKNEKD